MSNDFEDSKSFWFNKSVDDSTHPTKALYLTNGVDKQFRPIVIMKNMPRWPVGLMARQQPAPALLLHHYVTYLASLVPLKRLKNGLALIVDTNSFNKQDTDCFKEFVSFDYACMFYQLSVYCLCKNNKPGRSLDLPSEIKIIYVSCLDHLHRYVSQTQLPPQFGGTLNYHPESFNKFVKDFENLEMFITKDLNKYMMIMEHVKGDMKSSQKKKKDLGEMGWTGRSYEDILWSHKTIKQSWSKKTLKECERILEKFKNPQKYFTSVMYNPAFQLASEKLYLYRAELLNLNNFYCKQLTQMERFLGISTPSPVFEEKSHLSNRFSDKNNIFHNISDVSSNKKLKKVSLGVKSTMKLKNLLKKKSKSTQYQGLSAKLSQMLSQSTPYLNSQDIDHSSNSYLSAPEAKNNRETNNLNSKAALKKWKSEDINYFFNDSNKFDDPEYAENEEAIENNKYNKDNNLSDLKMSSHLHDDMTQLNREGLRRSLMKKKPSKSVPSNDELDDEKSLNRTLDAIDELYVWYVKALELFHVKLSAANSNEDVDKVLIDKVSIFVKENPLNSKSLHIAQQAIPEVKEDNIKNDLNILVYRVYCLEKVFKNFKYLKLFELKEVLFWKEQYQVTNSKNAPLQSFPELMDLKKNETKIIKNNFLSDQINNSSKQSSLKSKQSIESYLINQTPFTKKEQILEQPHKMNSFTSTKSKNISSLNLMYKDMDFEELIASLPKNTPKNDDTSDIEKENFEDYLKNIKSFSQFKPASSNPLIINPDSYFKNPLYSSYSSSEVKEVDPLENLDLRSVSGTGSFVINERIQKMNRLLDQYDLENCETNLAEKSSGLIREDFPSRSDNRSRHPSVTPPSYISVVNNVPIWENKGSMESGVGTITSSESKNKFTN